MVNDRVNDVANHRSQLIFLLGEASRLNLEVSVQQRIQSRWTQNFSGQE